jgi:hypothetical protein
LMMFLCRIHRKIASGQIHDYKYRDVKKMCILSLKIC